MSPNAIRTWPSSALASAAETMSTPGAEAVYGSPLAVLASVSAEAIQTSPLVVGARGLESFADATLGRVVIEAPPGTLERRYALAHGLRALAPGGLLGIVVPASWLSADNSAEVGALRVSRDERFGEYD